MTCSDLDASFLSPPARHHHQGDYPCLGGLMAKYSYLLSWRQRTLPAGPATPFILVVSSRRRARDDALREDGRSSSDCGWNPFPGPSAVKYYELDACRLTRLRASAGMGKRARQKEYRLVDVRAILQPLPGSRPEGTGGQVGEGAPSPP